MFRAIAAVIGRGIAATESADKAPERVIDACASTGGNAVAMVSLLYQTHDATAALVVETILAGHRDTVRASAVNQTRRVAVTDTVIGDVPVSAGSMVVLDLAAAGMEFGAGPHQCPGRLVAEAIVDGIIGAVDAAGFLVRDVSSSVDDNGRPKSIMMRPRPAVRRRICSGGALRTHPQALSRKCLAEDAKRTRSESMEASSWLSLYSTTWSRRVTPIEANARVAGAPILGGSVSFIGSILALTGGSSLGWPSAVVKSPITLKFSLTSHGEELVNRA